jgi:hypothetical protein
MDGVITAVKRQEIDLWRQSEVERRAGIVA